jgi:hypothetical protein
MALRKRSVRKVSSGAPHASSLTETYRIHISVRDMHRTGPRNALLLLLLVVVVVVVVVVMEVGIR